LLDLKQLDKEFSIYSSASVINMASDIGGAVAALQAAGEDIDALITAVGKAKFLDEIPGEERQKLRGEGVAEAPARCQPASDQRCTAAASKQHASCTRQLSLETCAAVHDCPLIYSMSLLSGLLS
jgi:hypothetical protein